MARILKKSNTPKPAVLVRVVKFPVVLSDGQQKTRRLLSDNIFEIWNHCLNERRQYFEEHLAPLYTTRREMGDTPNLKADIKSAYAKAPVNYITGEPERSQRSWLTNMRQSRSNFAALPCAWQQETLVILEGAYDSYMKLRKNGDQTARPPREKAADSFCEIQGLLGWQIIVDGRKINPQKEVTAEDRRAIVNASSSEIILSPGKTLYNGPELRWPIPSYQRLVLAEAVKLNKFTLYRKGQTDYISIAYSVPKPDTTVVENQNKVFLVLGATSIGVSAPERSFTINLWRSDKHWMTQIETLRERLKKCVKGSRSWQARINAINRMYEIMRLQTLQHHREVIAKQLKRHGAHFVIMEQSPIRGKKGALADGDNPARGGTLGANWSVQNTGSLAQLRQLLEQKVAEWGGSVELVKLAEYPRDVPREIRRQVAATALRSQVLGGNKNPPISQ
jgi:transposase